MVTTDTTTARGLLMPNLKPNPKPKLIPPLMLGTDTMAVTDTDMADHTMVDTTDTITDTDTDTTVKNCFFNVISCHFSNNPPLELSKPTLLPSAITSSVLLSGYDIQLLSEIVILSENC